MAQVRIQLNEFLLKCFLQYESPTDEELQDMSLFSIFDDVEEYVDLEKSYQQRKLVLKRLEDDKLFAFDYYRSSQGIEFDSITGHEVREIKKTTSTYEWI